MSWLQLNHVPKPLAGDQEDQRSHRVYFFEKTFVLHQFPNLVCGIISWCAKMLRLLQSLGCARYQPHHFAGELRTRRMGALANLVEEHSVRIVA